ncbi:flagellar hook-basal body protein [Poriferisphaera sp. WC338]|uniref:flagellar hook-basal body protein n=1 Tax=Poriferisphaera sp. WC338 TaxID=3425129 RepID=UPI003D812ACC
MNYGLYLSASGVLTNMYRQDVFANNLANADTAGFKPDFADLMQRAPEATEKNLSFDVSQQLLDRLGGGVLAAAGRTSFKQGALKHTGINTDIGLSQPKQFLAVEDQENGADVVRLTRDGRISMNSEGYLVLPNGKRVLDQSDKPILVERARPFFISPAGEVMQDGQAITKLQVAKVENTDVLVKRGSGLFAIDDLNQREVLENVLVKPGFIENSAVDPITSLMNMINATKAATGNAKMIQYHDTFMDRAVNTLGRVTA